MIDDFIYAIDVFSPPSNPDDIPAPLPVDQIEKNLIAVVEDAKARKSKGEKAAKIGVFTADDRDSWTNVHPLLFLEAETLTVASESRNPTCPVPEEQTFPRIDLLLPPRALSRLVHTPITVHFRSTRPPRSRCPTPEFLCRPQRSSESMAR